MKKLFITALCFVIAAAMCLTGCTPAEDTSESGNHGGNVEPEAVAFTEINETLTPGSYTLGATVTPAEASQAVIFSVIGTAAGVTLTGNTLTVSENAPDGVTFRVKVAAQTDPTVSATKTFTISNTAPAATAITTEAELRAMNLNGSYVLGGNIVLTSPWVPLGTPDNEETGTTGVGFAGTLDGAGYTISGIVIEGLDKGNEGANVGFFNKIESTGVIKNIGFESGTGENDGLSARCWSAAVAGYNFGLIENVYTNVKVAMTAAPGCPGGAMVSTNHGTIKNSYAIGQVTVAEGGTHGASFVCSNKNTVTNSYFLNTAGNCAIGWQKQQNPNIQKSEEWLKNPANFIEAGWDESVWCFVDGYYPMLRHEGFVAPAPLATISITNTEEYLDYNVEQQRTLQINYVIKNLENTAVTFALQSAVAGVSLSETGLVTLSDAVADGATFTVTVTSVEKTDLTASITLTVNRANVEEIIEISTLAQLKVLTTTTNPADLAKNYRLKNDIEMEGWFNENIGAAANTAFTGTFDGNGYTLNNIQGGNAAANFGIFKEIGAGGVVKNLRVVTSDRRLYVGAASAAITSVNRGTIENVIVEGEIMCTGVWVAGIAFDNYGTIKNCINLAKIEINEDASTLATKAGIACNNNEGGTITDCYVDKTVTTIVNALNAADAALDAKCVETSVLKTASTFTGWDSDVWTIVDGEYPALKHN